MQARYYDPVIGRFYSNDPVDAMGQLENGDAVHGFNRYSYANNNPYKYIDPDGLDSYDIQAAKRRATNGKGGIKIDSIDKGMAALKGMSGLAACTAGGIACGAGFVQIVDASRELSALESGSVKPPSVVQQGLEITGISPENAKPLAGAIDVVTGVKGAVKGVVNAMKNLFTQSSWSKVGVPLAEATTEAALVGY